MLRIPYPLMLLLLSPLIFLVTLRQSHTRQGGWRFIRERFGILSLSKQRGIRKRAWFHAASVGELQALKPLITRLETPILLTTNTPEAARLAERLPGVQLHHAYCPLDYAWAVRVFIRAYQPLALFVVETELWPNLYAQCHQADIAICIVNGRISKKTLRAPAIVRAWYKQALAHVRHIWARSESDAQSFLALGAHANKVSVLGNLKYASLSQNPAGDIRAPVTRPYVLALSTHDNEENQLAHVWQQMASPPLLIIMPRHPQRGEKIAKALLSQGFSVAMRSRDEPIDDTTQIYLADTIGEVPLFVPSALWVFMGGSLVPIGGHNMLEPACMAKAIVTGPSLDNFVDEAAYLREHKALLCVNNTDELKHLAETDLSDPHFCRKMGEHARFAMSQASHVGEQYLENVRSVLSQAATDYEGRNEAGPSL